MLYQKKIIVVLVGIFGKGVSLLLETHAKTLQKFSEFTRQLDWKEITPLK